MKNLNEELERIKEIMNIISEKTLKNKPISVRVETPKPTKEPVVNQKPTEEPVVNPKPTKKPVATPKPTPKPTKEPVETPRPTPILTTKPKPNPTSTPKPTKKPVATPKPTPKPTSTPKPTPKPTLTPKPTETPKSNKSSWLSKQIDNSNKKRKSNLDKNLKTIEPGANMKNTGINANPTWAKTDQFNEIKYLMNYNRSLTLNENTQLEYNSIPPDILEIITEYTNKLCKENQNTCKDCGEMMKIMVSGKLKSKDIENCLNCDNTIGDALLKCKKMEGDIASYNNKLGAENTVLGRSKTKITDLSSMTVAITLMYRELMSYFQSKKDNPPQGQ
jgi:hypothetical protein